jgi:hypothetical protein
VAAGSAADSAFKGYWRPGRTASTSTMPGQAEDLAHVSGRGLPDALPRSLCPSRCALLDTPIPRMTWEAVRRTIVWLIFRRAGEAIGSWLLVPTSERSPCVVEMSW